jgi:hypothetical protein
MNALKAAVWVSKIEDRRDALRLRFHTMGVKALLNYDDQESIKPQRLTFATLPDYLKEKGLSGLLYIASTPAIIASWFKPKSIFGALLLFIFLLIVIALFLMALISGGMYYYLSQPVDEHQLQRYLKQHQQSIAISVHDKNNQLIGALSPLASDYKNQTGALYVKTVPPLYWALIKAPNDKNLSFEQQQPSFWSLYKKIIRFQDASYKGVNLSASYQLGQHNDALIMRIAKGLQGGDFHQQKQSIIERFFKGQETLGVARHLYPYLSQNNGAEFKRWSAMHAPLLSAKNDVYGLGAISVTLFGKIPEQLTAGQQAVLATAYYQKTKMALLFSTKPKERQTTWTYLLKKTKSAATRYLKMTQPQVLRRVLVDLEAMKVAPSIEMSSQWLKFIEKQQDKSLSLYQNLLQRSTLTLGKIKDDVSKSLQHVKTSLDNNTVLTDVKISLPIFQNHAFDQSLDKAFSITHRFYPNLFAKKLGAEAENKGAVISIQVANDEGNIIRSYQRGLIDKRPIAGLNTFAISSLLLSRNDTPKTRYCNKSYAGIRNTSEPLRDGIANCKTLNRKGYSFSLQQSIREEKVLSLLYALTQVHKLSATQLLTLYKHFSISSDTVANSMPSTNKLAYELSRGNVKSHPNDMHTMIHSITRYLYGIPYDNNPSVIDTMQMNQLISKDGQYSVEYTSRQGVKSSTNTLERYFSDQTTRRYMTSLFSIPTTKKNNPLKFLHSVEKKYGVDFLLVKSATSKTNNGNTKDKWLIGSVRLKQHIYSFSIMIGSDGSSGGLGKNISHQQLMLPVMNTLIESLQR